MPINASNGVRQDVYASSNTGGIDLSGVLDWRLVGPHRGGRVVAVAGDPQSPMVFYFGACAGGVWKTTDGGDYWENVSDGFFNTAAIGAIAVAPSDPNVIYAGTGETTIRSNVSHGDGVYKSTDGGKTWRNMGLAATRHIAKIRIHPQNPDLVYVAALGHAWGPNEERGLYRSRDGGETWERVLHRGDRAGAIDLSMDPNNLRILYVAFWEAQRFPHALSSGGPGSGLFKSSDGGDTWTELTNNPGLPDGLKGKIGVAASPAQADRVWALVEAKDGGLFRSDDGGQTWQRLSEDAELRRRAWYYMHIYADPQDPETVWVLNLQCWKSTDGGRTFTAVATPHGDNHDLWIDPRNPQRMIEGNDGGACVTLNGGASWSTLYNQPTAQMYHVTTDTQLPYRVYGSQQDNTAISIPSLSSRGAITQTEWYEPGGGESGYIAIQPDDSNIVYGGAIGSGAFNGRLFRYDHRTGQERNITVWPEETGMGDGAISLKYRFQWTFPIVISPHDPNVLYVAGNMLFRSTDRGESWEAISRDLTRDDPEKLQPSGGPITKDNTGAEVYCTIFSFQESPIKQGLFWAGTDDGLVHISRDGGQTWQNITPPDLPEWTLVTSVEPSRHDPAVAYLSGTRYKLDDWRPYLYKTADYGESWQEIAAGIPDGEFTRILRADPVTSGLLYAGTETGAYVSLDDGASWQSLQGNLPVAPVYDFAVRDDDLVVATHGRSFWILDDVTPLRQLVGNLDGASDRLFQPRVTIRYKVYEGYGTKLGAGKDYRLSGTVGVTFKRHIGSNGEVIEKFLDAGKNPPSGVIVTYYLQQEPEGEVVLTFRSQEGEEIRRFTSKTQPRKVEDASTDGRTVAESVTEQGAEGLETSARKDATAAEEDLHVSKQAGMNRFVWNLRYPDARKLEGDKSTEELLSGPAVPPGKYQVELSVGGRTLTQQFEVRKDPRVNVTQEDFEAQFALLMQIRDKLSETHDAVNTLRDLREQLEQWGRRLPSENGVRALRERAEGVRETLSRIEGELVQVNADTPLGYSARLNEKLAMLATSVESADGAPTRQEQDVFRSLSERINAQLDRLRKLVSEELPAFNRMVREEDVPAITPTSAALSRM